MQIVIILIPLVLIVVTLGVVLFSWAVKSGQYDDLEGPAHRILYDDDADMIPEEARQDKPASSADQTTGADNSVQEEEQEPPQQK